MDNDNHMKTLLKWAAITALVAIPVAALLRMLKDEPVRVTADDDIFTSELEG